MIRDIRAVGTAIAIRDGQQRWHGTVPFNTKHQKEEVMKKSTIAVPVAIALRLWRGTIDAQPVGNSTTVRVIKTATVKRADNAGVAAAEQSIAKRR
jgi:hypothetical protein